MNAISIKNLVKKYNTKSSNPLIAVNNISFEIKAGEFFGLLGQNGAGKTTTINILTGLSNKTSGKVKLFGKDIVDNYLEARALIGLVPQEFNFDKFETVYNILYFNAGYFGIPRKERKDRIKKILQELSLWEKKDAKAIELSGGMKRKLMIARALVHKPKILILDEPTAGVDVETRKIMWTYLQQLNKQGMTILLTTHYLEEAEELCERIAIINKGKIIKLDLKSNLLNLLEQEKVKVYLKEELKTVPSSLLEFNHTLDKQTITFSINPQKQEWEKLLAALNKTNLSILKFETYQNKLEDIFIQLTREK
jgi:ABC-2 type transport system ATP-binding protein